jgi:hypothetical protein
MQTEYKSYMEPFIIGQIADTSPRTINSFAAEGKIEFASAVGRGTNESKQCLPLDDINSFLGIALRNDLCTQGYYSVGEVVSVMNKGRVVIKAKEAVKAGDKAYVHADGTINKTLKKDEKNGLAIGIFASTQSTENELVILELK